MERIPGCDLKKRIAISISTETLREIDRLLAPGISRSAYLEKVLTDHLQRVEYEAIQQRDMELINAHAEALNREAEETLRDQDYYLGLREELPSEIVVKPS